MELGGNQLEVLKLAQKKSFEPTRGSVLLSLIILLNK